MVAYLSEEWFTEAAAALADDDSLRAASRGLHLVLEQRVLADEADGAPAIVWHVTFDDGEVHLDRGPARRPTVTFACDRTTAESIQRGAASAQVAFLHGRLRLGGDVGALLAHPGLLAGVDDALADLRTVQG